MSDIVERLREAHRQPYTVDPTGLPATVTSLLAESATTIATLRKALEDADRFIINGIHLGYIAAPDVLDDPAHDTIRSALSRAALQGNSTEKEKP